MIPTVLLVPMAPAGDPEQVTQEIVRRLQSSFSLPFPMVPIVPMDPQSDPGQVTQEMVRWSQSSFRLQYGSYGSCGTHGSPR